VVGVARAGVGVSVLAGSYEALRGDDVAFVPLAGRQTTLDAAWRADSASVALRNFVDVARRVAGG
jgi:hypothetical protein